MLIIIHNRLCVVCADFCVQNGTLSDEMGPVNLTGKYYWFVISMKIIGALMDILSLSRRWYLSMQSVYVIINYNRHIIERTRT